MVTGIVSVADQNGVYQVEIYQSGLEPSVFDSSADLLSLMSRP